MALFVARLSRMRYIQSNEKKQGVTIMEILMLYRTLCHAHVEWGRALASAELMHLSGLNRTTFYRYMNRLEDSGFVYRPVRGWWLPLDVYQWHMDDFMRGETNE